MSNSINIALSGARGKMGRAAVRMIAETDPFVLKAAIDHKFDGEDLERHLPEAPGGVKIYTDIEACFSEEEIDVLVDFTYPEVGKRYLQSAIDHGVNPVVGTSGFNEDDVAAFRKQMEEKRLGGIIAPNFAVGAVLMMKFSQLAAKYLPDVEIIEMHHDNKKDAPSGTAVKTAELIKAYRESHTQGHPEEQETLPGARGAEDDGLRIHSVRLPGLVAHQQVLFGGTGELLTLRHDSMDRGSFMNGVRLAVETVQKLDTLVYGLDQIID